MILMVSKRAQLKSSSIKIALSLIHTSSIMCLESTTMLRCSLPMSKRWSKYHIGEISVSLRDIKLSTRVLLLRANSPGLPMDQRDTILVVLSMVSTSIFPTRSGDCIIWTRLVTFPPQRLTVIMDRIWSEWAWRPVLLFLEDGNLTGKSDTTSTPRAIFSMMEIDMNSEMSSLNMLLRESSLRNL